jgi:hypothetical protein
MSEEEPVAIFDYPLLSDERVNAGRDLAEAGPGQRVFGDEKVWKDDGEFEPGDPKGSVTIEEIPTTRPGRVKFHAIFDHDDPRGPIVVEGFLPGNGNWNGVTHATAYGQGRQGTVRVEGRNPKRWG